MLIQRFPDVTKGTPMVPARLEWTSGETYTYKDDKGHPVMVPAFDPAVEDFVERHEHGIDDNTALRGSIQVYEVDQKTWDSVDVVTKIKAEMHEMTGKWYEDRDTYREGAIACYNEHGNPDATTGCRDYMDDSKRIGRVHYRDDRGREHTIPQKFRQYLCYQCPYQQAYINVELRKRKKLYA